MSVTVSILPWPSFRGFSVNWFLKLLYPEAERGGLDEVFSNIFKSMEKNGPSGLLVTPHLIGALQSG